MTQQFTRIAFILGDQLNIMHSWFNEIDHDTLYVLAELPQELNYCRHHQQKIVAFFAAMRAFYEQLIQQGHHCQYLDLDAMQHLPDNLPALLEKIASDVGASQVSYQQPDEWRLFHQLRQWQSASLLQVEMADTEHFFLSHSDLEHEFKPNKAIRMEAFYRRMRKRFEVLMDAEDPSQPEGGRWNFDAENRQTFTSGDLAEVPEPLLFKQSAQAINARLARHAISMVGEACDVNRWPSDRASSLQLLAYFCQVMLPKFGQFQDAMTHKIPQAWSLYHSRLSFSLNVKILSPHEVIEAAVKAYYQNDAITVAQVEGFVRQILGWREYVRGMYWVNMPDYAEKNALAADNKLPDWFWHGKTRMHCLHQAIEQSLEYAYSHHIQRLMITGNFALLAGIAPDEVDAWYLGIYIDAIEWVEMPNTRGMALSADGGLIASKPYIASANYINKMSDSCKNCYYDPKKKTGECACPFNSLYWHFLYKHRALYERNPRLAFAYKYLNKMSEDERAALLQQADRYLSNLSAL